MDALKPKRLQLYLASFFLDALGHALPLLVSFHARHSFGASAFELGLLGAIWMTVYSVGCFATGGWSDRIGSMPILRLSLLSLGGLLLPMLFFVSKLWHLHAAMACFGVGLAFCWPPLQRQLALYSPGRRLWPALGAFNIWWAAGAVLGTISGGPSIYQELTWSGVLVGLIGFVGLTFALLHGLKGGESYPQAPEQVEAVDPGKALLFLRLGWAANFCAAFAMGGVHLVFADVARKLSLDPAWSTAILASKEAGRLATFALLRRYSGWHYSFRWLCVLQLLAGGALLVGGWITNPAGLCVLFAMLGVFSGISYYSSILYSLNLRAEEGKKTGIHEGILAIGVVLGPLTIGAAGQLMPGWAGSAMGVAGCVVLLGLGVEAAMMVAASTRSSHRVTSVPS